MRAGTAGYYGEPARHWKIVELGYPDAIPCRRQTACHAVIQNIGLLKDLLEHEVPVSALLGRLHIPFDGLHPVFHRSEILDTENSKAVLVHAGYFAIFQEDNLAGIGQKCRNIGGYKVFPCANAENERSGHAGSEEDIGILHAHEADGIGAMSL